MALKIVKVTDSKTSEQLEALGLRAFEGGDLDKAAEHLLAALKLNDKNAALFLKLGVVLVQKGEYDKALIAIKQSLELDPYNADAFNAMGVVLFRMELWGASEQFFQRAIALDATHAIAKKSLVEVRKHLRNGDNELPPNFELVMALLEVKEPTLSLCMIVKNEEEFLEDCLASVKDVVDEIVIVDTGSTDRTLEIAERFSAKIHHYAWHGDFAAARNESLKYATGDWILVLDADERIPAEWHGELKKAIRNTENVGYSLIIENLLGVKGESRQTAMIFRLFQNRPDMRYEGIIHEQIILAAQRTGRPIGNTLTHITHLGYLNQCLDQRDKHQRNLAILLEQEKLEPENPYVFFNLGQTYKLLGRFDDSERSYQRCLDLLKGQNASHAIAYYANLYFSFIELYRMMGDFEKGLALAEEAIGHYPTYPDVVFSKGHILLSLGRPEEAIKCFEACRKFQGVVFAAGNDPSVTTYKSSSAMGVAYSRMGKNALAKQHFERALKEWNHPDAEIHTNLGIIHLQEGNTAKALEHFTKALENNDQYFRAWFNLGTICFKLGKIEDALAAWLKAREIEPETPELGLLIGEACLKLGRHDQAVEAFEAELARAPGSQSAHLSLGIARMAKGDVAGARTAWKAILEAGSEAGVRGDAEALLSFAALLEQGTLSVPEASLVSSQRLGILWAMMIDHLLVAGSYAEVERILGELQAAAPAEVARPIGMVLFQKGLHEAALAFFLKAREEAPEDPELYFLIAECASAGGNVEDARIMYQMALSLNPRDARSRERMGRLPAPQPIA